MSLAEEKLREIAAFIKSLRLSSPELRNPDERLRKTYNTFHGLLMLDLAATHSNYNDSTKTHFQELLSDSSSALFLILVGSFKPSRLVLRGAIENALRFLVGTNQVDPASIRTVSGLFAKAKDVATGSPSLAAEIGRLEGRYDELCKTTHAVHVDYMALAVPFESLFHYDKEQFDDDIKVLTAVFQSLFNICFAVLHQFLNRIDHKSADAIRDIAPRALKAALND